MRHPSPASLGQAQKSRIDRDGTRISSLLLHFLVEYFLAVAELSLNAKDDLLPT